MSTGHPRTLSPTSSSTTLWREGVGVGPPAKFPRLKDTEDCSPADVDCSADVHRQDGDVALTADVQRQDGDVALTADVHRQDGDMALSVV